MREALSVFDVTVGVASVFDGDVQVADEHNLTVEVFVGDQQFVEGVFDDHASPLTWFLVYTDILEEVQNELRFEFHQVDSI